MSIGRRHWAITEGWIPPTSHRPEPAMMDSEAIVKQTCKDALESVLPQQH